MFSNIAVMFSNIAEMQRTRSEGHVAIGNPEVVEAHTVSTYTYRDLATGPS